MQYANHTTSLKNPSEQAQAELLRLHREISLLEKQARTGAEQQLLATLRICRRSIELKLAKGGTR